MMEVIMLIKCRECGLQVSNLAVFCPHCGCPVTNEEEKSGKKKKHRTKKVVQEGGFLMDLGR